MHKNKNIQISIIVVAVLGTAALLVLYIKKIPHPTPRPVPSDWIKRMERQLPPPLSKPTNQE